MEGEGVIHGRGKNKQHCSEEETKTLIDILRELAADSTWKTDGEFRSNYMDDVYKRMLERIPSFSKKVSPHLQSKIKWLKNKYHAMTSVDKVGANGMRDRAAGVVTQTYVGVVHEMENVINVETENETFTTSSGDENVIIEDSEVKAVPIPSSSTQVLGKRKSLSPKLVALMKKKKTSAEPQILENNFKDFTGKSGSLMEVITSQYSVIANALNADSKPEPLASNKMQEVVKELLYL
ncbi:OLC1v1005794C1 [Oldenlandia corymbosa var. corymbosa]|uniref:OLC1v1005794C1 n=1 Tax=Oldenlandia corymbosa var. corymbosa TaxID=529605 RepID=A0AAV1DIV6_OLDCO|nr:OLC1v1005794C1 [Oldenlandia corymbosa var. corymbosa]